MIDPLSVPNVDPYPTWQTPGRQQHEKRSSEKKKQDPDSEATVTGTDDAEEPRGDLPDEDGPLPPDDPGTRIDLEA